MKPGDRILDIGAGTVVYSFHFDNLGYKVDAIVLRDANCQVIKSKMSSDCKINLYKEMPWTYPLMKMNPSMWYYYLALYII